MNEVKLQHAQMLNELLTSYCSFCFPAGMPVASWILTLITDTYEDISVAAFMNETLAVTKNKNKNKSAQPYLVCERNSEIQNLPIQLPFSLVLHVGDLNLYSHRTLEIKKLIS